MRIGQPIAWKAGDELVAGVVKEVLPCKAGVLAYIQIDGKLAVVKVKEPHKIREAETVAMLVKHYADLPEVQEWLEGNGQPTATPKPKAPKPTATPKTDAENKATFTAALAEIEAAFSGKGSIIDTLHVHGMGFNFTADVLPKSDPTTTPIDKLFF